MKLAFAKMEGAGNDFVVVDSTDKAFALTKEQLQRLADRHFGIGCDQILVVQRPSSPGADFAYRIFNADGGEVEQCGNGARCLRARRRSRWSGSRPIRSVRATASRAGCSNGATAWSR